MLNTTRGSGLLGHVGEREQDEGGSARLSVVERGVGVRKKWCQDTDSIIVHPYSKLHHSSEGGQGWEMGRGHGGKKLSIH